jgi:hypothetical protein
VNTRILPGWDRPAISWILSLISDSFKG